MKLTYVKTLSEAKKCAESKGYRTEERNGRLYFYKGGVEVGSTLIDTYTPEPTISKNAESLIYAALAEKEK